MQVDIPDPDYTSSERARASFRLAVKIALSFVALIWLIDILSWTFDLELQRFGIRPRQLAGLPGILFAPLLHGGPVHLSANSLPLLVLGTGMLYLYPNSVLKALPAIYLGPGIAVWLFAEGGVHVGSSGLAYGLASYVFVAGVIRLDRRAIAASLLVSFLYGTMVWGVLPIQPRVSWETHLAAALIGLALAIALRRLDIPPRKRYSWEGEEGGQDERDAGNDESRVTRSTLPMMTDAAYIAAYQKLTREYQDNRLSMEEYLPALEKLKAEYLKGRAGAALPDVP